MANKLRIVESICLLLAILLILITAILTIALTENFGNYVHDGTITMSGKALTGSFAQAILGLQSCVIIFTGLYVMFHLIRARIETKEEFERFEPLFGKQILWFSFEKWILLTTLASGITSAALDIHLVQNFTTVPNLTTEPNPIVPEKNATLSGPYGTGVFAVGVISLALSFFSILLKSDDYMTASYFPLGPILNMLTTITK